MELMALPTAAPLRVMRVFVSSTFHDMHAEREELVKRVFPELRRVCEERGVTWGEVDLRWGITDEEAAERRVLPICLAEVENCQPFFVGLLGERYGWVPTRDAIPDDLLAREPWIAALPGRSVSELEIEHGALRRPLEQTHAYFYFRAVDAGLRVDQDADAARRQTELKDRIRAKGYPVRAAYRDAPSLGKLVLADLTALIDHLFPGQAAPTARERAEIDQQIFAERLTSVYVGRRRDFDRLDAHASGQGPPPGTRGRAGERKIGAACQLARRPIGPRGATPTMIATPWERAVAILGQSWRPRPKEPESLVVHYVGAAVDGADVAAMLRRVMARLLADSGREAEIPTDWLALQRAFAATLSLAARRGRVVLVLDGLDHLDGDPDPTWLPDALDPNLRLIVSAAPGPTFTALQRRRWPTWPLRPLRPADRATFIPDYLAKRARKRLGPGLVRLIAAADPAANPLYLRTLLEELRVFGTHETLRKTILGYLEAPTTEALYGKVLARLEADYDGAQPGLVRSAFSFLWAARRGVGDTELLDLLGSSGAPLPSAAWSPLYLAMRESLMSRSGVLTFFHPALRAAVEKTYLATDALKAAVHRHLASYFAARPISVRVVEELPGQYQALGDWLQLATLLARPAFVEAAWAVDPLAVRAFWARIEASSPYRLADAYRPVIAAPAAYRACARIVADLLAGTGHSTEALALLDGLLQAARAATDLTALKEVLGRRAVVLKDRGTYAEAIATALELETLGRRTADRAAQASALGLQAVLHRRLGDRARARALHSEEEAILRATPDEAGLAVCLGNLASLLAEEGDNRRALQLYEQQERIDRQLGDLIALQANLGNQGVLLGRVDRWEDALPRHAEEETICTSLGDWTGRQISLGNQAMVLQQLGRYDEALERLDQRETICRGQLADPACWRDLSSSGRSSSASWARSPRRGSRLPRPHTSPRITTSTHPFASRSVMFTAARLKMNAADAPEPTRCRSTDCAQLFGTVSSPYCSSRDCLSSRVTSSDRRIFKDEENRSATWA